MLTFWITILNHYTLLIVIIAASTTHITIHKAQTNQNKHLCNWQSIAKNFNRLLKPIDCFKGNRLLIAVLTVSGRLYVLRCKLILNTFSSLKTCIKHIFIYIKWVRYSPKFKGLFGCWNWAKSLYWALMVSSSSLC